MAALEPTLHPATLGDVPAVAAMVAAVDTVDYGEPDVNADEILHDWSQGDFDPALDARVVRGDDGAIIACAEVKPRGDSLEFDGVVDVHPQHATAAAFAPLIGWMRARVTQRAAGRPAGLGVYCTRTNTTKAAALAAAGLACERVVLRLRIELGDTPPEPAPLAEGRSLAPFVTGDDDAALHGVLEAAFREHYRSHPRSLETWRTETLGDPQFDPQYFLLVRHAGQVVGGIEGFDRGEFGWVARVGVLASERGRGTARALLLEVMRRFHAAGRRRMELGVDAQNATGATRLYESIGMRTVLHYEMWRTDIGRV